jgi:hypothetical protein
MASTAPRLAAPCKGKRCDNQRKEVTTKETRLQKYVTKKNGLLEEHVRNIQRNGIDNVTDAVDNWHGGGMVTPSWAVGGGSGGGRNGCHQDELRGRVCGM